MALLVGKPWAGDSQSAELRAGERLPLEEQVKNFPEETAGTLQEAYLRN